MIVLPSTSHRIRVVLGSAVETNQLQFVASWRDLTATTYTPGTSLGTTNSTTHVDLVEPPAASTQRVVDYVSVYNNDTQPAVVTISLRDGTTDFVLWSGTLHVGWSVAYTSELGWSVRNAMGTVVSMSIVTSAATSVMMAQHFATANLTTTKTITSNSTFAIYVGKAPRSLASTSVCFRVTTAAATITWAEVAIAKGAINVGGNPTLTVVGFADVSGVVNSTGQKTVAVTVASTQSIAEGDDLWVLIGNQATTACVVRAQSIADDLQVGMQASLATRPSSNVGVTQAYTIESETTAGAWVALVI